MNKDDPKLLEAILLAQTTIRTSSKKMDRNAIAVLNKFLNDSTFALKRKKITDRTLEKIVNIAKSIK
jgi:hypothetical protein